MAPNIMYIRLTRKLANVLNGIDVSRLRVGDVVDLPLGDARVLIAEGWASPIDEKEPTQKPPRKT